MSDRDRMARVIKHIWTEPRFLAEFEWLNGSDSISQQLERQVGRGAMETYVATGHWPDPDQEVTLVMPDEPPDWDWWEPTTRWRRIAARDREFDAS
jgi:hypothetical protein